MKKKGPNPNDKFLRDKLLKEITRRKGNLHTIENMTIEPDTIKPSVIEQSKQPTCFITLSNPAKQYDELTKEKEKLRLIELEKKCNYTNVPGFHTKLSPIPGTRWSDLQMIIQKKEIFKEFQNEIYNKQNLNVIPLKLKKEADEISKKLFSDYLDKYKELGVTVDNAVNWVNYDFTKTFLHDLENEWSTWKIETDVATPEHKSHIKNSMYRSAYICALHEIMHVEETCKGISKAEFEKFNCIDEVLTVTKTIILMDFVFKSVMKIPLEQEADYNRTFNLFGNKFTQGAFANFYRNLELKYDNLAVALISDESIKYLNGNPNIPQPHFPALVDPQLLNKNSLQNLPLQLSFHANPHLSQLLKFQDNPLQSLHPLFQNSFSGESQSIIHFPKVLAEHLTNNVLKPTPDTLHNTLHEESNANLQSLTLTNDPSISPLVDSTGGEKRQLDEYSENNSTKKRPKKQ